FIGSALLAFAFLGMGALAGWAEKSSKYDKPHKMDKKLERAAEDWNDLDAWCGQSRQWNDGDDGGHHCEVRRVRLEGEREVLAVDAGLNGGIAARGWDEDAIRVL